MSNVIKIDEVSYFPYDEHSDTPEWVHSFDVYIRLKSQSKAFEFHIGAIEAASINRQLADPASNFITFSSDFGSTHVVNKRHLKWLTIHDESSSSYPKVVLSEDGEVETKYSRICKVDFTQNNVLWMLPSIQENEDSRTYADFSFLHSLGTRLNIKITRAIAKLRESKADNYYHHLEDEEHSGYRRKFIESWGCRTYMTDASEYFQPGYSGPEILGGIFKGHALKEKDSEDMFLRLSNHSDTTHFMPMKDIEMLECPTVFLGIDTFMCQQGMHWNPTVRGNDRADECRKLARV